MILTMYWYQKADTSIGGIIITNDYYNNDKVII